MLGPVCHAPGMHRILVGGVENCSLYPRTHHFLHVFIPFTNSHIERHDFLHDTEPATLSRPVVPFLFILTHKGCL
jgi:hypothetical protein